jgi:NADH-quinone oxidoreductase subunit B
MGGCTISGGPFKYPGEYAIAEGAEKFMPVDVHIPGCPPRPEALLAGILRLEEKIKQGRRFELPPSDISRQTSGSAGDPGHAGGQP